MKAAVDAHAGLGHVSYGPDKGDWQLLGGLDGTASGHLSEDLFGGTAEGQGTINGDVTVLFSPDGTPKELEVTASGDGVWHVAPPSGLNPRLPDNITVRQPEGGEGSGSGSPGAAARRAEAPRRGARSRCSTSAATARRAPATGASSRERSTSATHPQAEQDVNALLEGDPTKIDALINDMNTSGEERVWNYKVNRSDSSYGASGNFVVGAAGHVSDGTATMQDSPPEIREDGGKWHSAAGSP